MRRAGRLGICWLWIVIVMGVGAAHDAEARITIRSHATLDEFSFHAQYWDVPFDPADDFALEIWTCANGMTPTYIAQRDPIVVCRDETGGAASTPADLAYAVEVPGGTCVDHGQSCYMRNPDSTVRDGGIRYFKVQYAKRDQGNKIWLETVDDLSAANAAHMLLLISIAGWPRALLEGTFVPLGSRGLSAEFR